ncbi:MAG: class I SAM-dependent methyltransferase [Cyanobacteria bacterium P01_E01_bin.34]
MLVFDRILCCPICRQNLGQRSPGDSHCADRCTTVLKASLRSAQTYPILDLTPEALTGTPTSQPLRTRLFQTQAIAFTYERLLPALWAMGLRQSGIEHEGARVVEWFSGGDGNGNSATALDLSCGTGIVTCRLLHDTLVNVVAIDYSAEMLEELQTRCQNEGIDPERLALVRGDATSLPLQPNSIDAVYSGAAMHCWPDAEVTVKQIHTALKPDGKLYLTTFLKPLPSLIFRFFTPGEIKRIAIRAGFPSDCLNLTTSGIYATLTAQKSGE